MALTDAFRLTNTMEVVGSVPPEQSCSIGSTSILSATKYFRENKFGHRKKLASRVMKDDANPRRARPRKPMTSYRKLSTNFASFTCHLSYQP